MSLTKFPSAKRISFKNGAITIAGPLHLPEGFSESRKYAGIVAAHPGGGVK